MNMRAGAIAILAVAYMVAAKIGSTFTAGLMIFSFFLWAVAACLFAYVILYRGMRLTIFSRKPPVANDDFKDVIAGEEQTHG